MILRTLCTTLLILLTLPHQNLQVMAQSGWAEPWEEAVVVSAEDYASQAGLEVLNKGGNAIDAAVAVQFALAVTLPRAGNIGGGGFMVIQLADGTQRALDFRERAPRSEEHTSELQSRGHLVCRLLLEK